MPVPVFGCVRLGSCVARWGVRGRAPVVRVVRAWHGCSKGARFVQLVAKPEHLGSFTVKGLPHAAVRATCRGQGQSRARVWAGHVRVCVCVKEGAAVGGSGGGQHVLPLCTVSAGPMHAWLAQLRSSLAPVPPRRVR